MARRRNPKKDDTLVDIVEARDNAQDFFEANQKTILMALVGAVPAHLVWRKFGNRLLVADAAPTISDL